MTKIHCDHCGKIIESPADGYTELAINIGGYRTQADLCSCCLGKLINITENFIDEADFEPMKGR